MPYPVVPDVPPFGGVKSQILQNAATGTANGTDFNVQGYATIVLLVAPDASYTGTVTFNASPDGATFTTIRGAKQTDGTLATSVVCSSGTATIWTFQLAGITAFRASIAGDNTNKVTVTGFVSNEPNLTPLAATITSTVLGAGSNIIGSANIVDSAGTNLLGVDSNHNAAVSVRVGTTPVPAGHGVAATAMRVELPTDGTGVVGLNAGSALVGGVNLVDSAGTNKAGVDAVHCVLVASGGTATTGITAGASGAAAVKASPGRLCRIIVTTLGTAVLNFYDNTNAATGTIIGSVPASAAAGTMYDVQLPGAVGIYAGGATNTPAVTVGYA